MVVSLDVFRGPGYSGDEVGSGSADRNDRRNVKSESESKEKKYDSALRLFSFL
jgi:hypothetical protein